MEDIIETLNSGDKESIENLESYFGGFPAIFRLLYRRKLIDKLDFEGPTSWLWIDSFYRTMLKLDKGVLLPFYLNLFKDVSYIGGKYYLEVTNFSNLSILFCKDIRKYVRNFLEGTIDFNIDIYASEEEIFDMINHFNKVNTQYLKNLFIHYLKDSKLEPTTELLFYISDRQKSGEYIIIDEENIDLIFQDKDTLFVILESYLEEIYEGLLDLYRQSYETDLSDQYYASIVSELSSILHLTPIQLADGMEGYEIIDFEYYVNQILTDTNADEVRGYYLFLELLYHFLDNDCLQVSYPEYADYQGLYKIANEWLTSTVS